VEADVEDVGACVVGVWVEEVFHGNKSYLEIWKLMGVNSVKIVEKVQGDLMKRV
jgi:hypothetical protein